MILSSEQARAAKAALNWSDEELASESNIPLSDVQDFLNDKLDRAIHRISFNIKIEEGVQKALENHGIEFTAETEEYGSGWRRKKENNDECEYRPAIVTFLDILGFKEIIAQRSAKEVEEIVRLVRFHAGSEDEENYIYGLAEHNWTRNVFFSDSVVRVRPYDSEYSEGSLFHEILDLVHAQAELSRMNVFVRGGVTVGKIRCRDNVLFGPAMNRAYELESIKAIYPRIIIGEEVLEQWVEDKRLRNADHNIDYEISFLEGMIAEDDGVYFVDYLRGFDGEADTEDDYRKLLETHKKHTVNAINKSKNKKVKSKYKWLSGYHNGVVSKLPKHASDPSLVIPPLNCWDRFVQWLKSVFS